MGKYESNRNTTARENAEVEKAFRQVTNTQQRKPASGKPTPGKPAPGKPKTPQERQQAEKKRQIIIISVCAAVLLLLIGLIVTVILVTAPAEDDGRILSNVYAGGVNLGGMTTQEATSALHLATDNTFSKKDMVITVAQESIVLPPAETGAKLDVDAVVQAAYQYGRTGSDKDLEQAKKDAVNKTYTIALLPYLKLDLDYIEDTIDRFCNSYSSVMTQPTAFVNGDRPAFDPEYPDLPVSHQTLIITLGTPDYALDSEDIYNLALDSYSLNKLEATYNPPATTEPEALSAEALFQEFCVAPVDAAMDPETYEVTPEVYGYGFDIPAVQKMIDEASYGQTLQIELNFIEPEITAKELTEDLFLDTLASFTSTNLGGNTSGRNNNLNLSCQVLNDVVLKAGEEFSFNALVGQPTAPKGYQKAFLYNHGESEILGGGISQTASTLYYCALMADLEILERHSHDYAVDFMERGFDANIKFGSQDLRFRNNTGAPIRILATAEGGNVTIQLLGINEREYKVQLKSVTVKQYDPITIKQSMSKDNVLGYKDGDVLETGIVGYSVETYTERYDLTTGELISSTLVEKSEYSKRDQTVVSIGPGTAGTEEPPIEDPDNNELPVVPLAS